MLLFVVDSLRSSPGRRGFFMVVNQLGDMSGSIGGGIMEHKFVELAKERLNQNVSIVKIIRQAHDKKAASNQSGMICSGEQTILMYTLEEKDILTINNIIQSFKVNKGGSLEITPSGICFLNNRVAEDIYQYKDEENWKYVQDLGCSHLLYIIGGGHCALALSYVMNTLDFYITVMDERRDLHTMSINYYADELVHIENYKRLADLIPEGQNVFIVVMTLGYRTDYIALRSLLSGTFGYIGVLGSDAKIRELFANYKKDGIEASMLRRLHAPVGISIKSETPEEIAISIAAEIIDEKNNQSRRKV